MIINLDCLEQSFVMGNGFGSGENHWCNHGNGLGNGIASPHGDGNGTGPNMGVCFVFGDGFSQYIYGENNNEK